MEIFEIIEFSTGDLGDRGKLMGYELAEDAFSAKQQYADKNDTPKIMDTGFVQASKIGRKYYIERLREAHHQLELHNLPKYVELDIEREMLLEHLRSLHIRTADDLFSEIDSYYDRHFSGGGIHTNGDKVVVKFKRSGHSFTITIKLGEVKL